jgi:sec-independent protein translocase protein TatA
MPLSEVSDPVVVSAQRALSLARVLASFAYFYRDLSRLRRMKMFEGLFQPMHLMVIAGLALLIFGPRKLPELGKGLGESIRGFKLAMAAKEESKPERLSAVSDREVES